MEKLKKESFLEMKVRLFEVFDQLGLKIPEVSKASGVPANTLVQIKNGRSESMNCHTLRKIIIAYPQINANYILSGFGKPLIDLNIDIRALAHLKRMRDDLQKAIDDLDV